MGCGKYLGIRLFTVIDISNNGQSTCPNITVLQRALSYMYNIYVCILHAQNGFFLFVKFCFVFMRGSWPFKSTDLTRWWKRWEFSFFFSYICTKTRCGFCRSRLHGQQGYPELAIDSIEFAGSEIVSTAQYDVCYVFIFDVYHFVDAFHFDLSCSKKS